jgi:hypothetical protein
MSTTADWLAAVFLLGALAATMLVHAGRLCPEIRHPTEGNYLTSPLNIHYARRLRSSAGS